MDVLLLMGFICENSLPMGKLAMGKILPRYPCSHLYKVYWPILAIEILSVLDWLIWDNQCCCQSIATKKPSFTRAMWVNIYVAMRWLGQWNLSIDATQAYPKPLRWFWEAVDHKSICTRTWGEKRCWCSDCSAKDQPRYYMTSKSVSVSVCNLKAI